MRHGATDRDVRLHAPYDSDAGGAVRVGMVFMESPAHPAVIVDIQRLPRKDARRLMCRYIWQDENDTAWPFDAPHSSLLQVATDCEV